jgi:hypothetical protein
MMRREMLFALLGASSSLLFAQAPLECLPDRGIPGTFVYDFADILSVYYEV